MVTPLHREISGLLTVRAQPVVGPLATGILLEMAESAQSAWMDFCEDTRRARAASGAIPPENGSFAGRVGTSPPGSKAFTDGCSGRPAKDLLTFFRKGRHLLAKFTVPFARDSTLSRTGQHSVAQSFY